MTRPMSPARALLLGLADVARSPLLVIGAALIMLVIALPFAAVLNARLQTSLSVQPQISLNDTEIDPEWWMNFRDQARGLEATFTPAIIGFAATLDGISNVLDGKRPANALLLPFALTALAWAFIWGGALHRFQRGRGRGPAGFVRAGASHLFAFIVLAVIAAAINLVLYLTLHKLLFGPVHTALVAMTHTERDAFLVRVLLYVIFFAPVALVSLAADYARVVSVAAGVASPVAAMRSAMTFIRARIGAVTALYLFTGLIFIVVTIGYGTLEVYGGSQVGGWRAVAIGQAYVLVRLAIRLTFAASELRLFSANQIAAAE
jgi:hypothetical protein